MIDTPEPSYHNDQTNSDLTDTRPASPKPSESNGRQEKPEQSHKYPEYLMRSLKAVGRGVVAVINWTDEKDGFITALATVLIAILTGYYVHYARGQWDAMRGQLTEMQGSGRQTDKLIDAANRTASAAQESASVSQEALHSTQRAFLTFRPSPDMTFIASPNGNIFQLEIPIENAGVTQAHALKDRISCETGLSSLSSDYTFPDKKGECGTPFAATGANVVPAKGQIFSQAVFIKDNILREIAEEHKGGPGTPDNPKRTVYLYGWVTYRDIFKDTPERLTEFCSSLALLMPTPQGGFKHEWSYCPTHNCTDEDCPDYKERIAAAHASPTARTAGKRNLPH